MNTVKQFEEMQKTRVAPALRELGLRGSGQDFRLPNDNGDYALLGFQKDSWDRPTRFTLNVAFYSAQGWQAARARHGRLPAAPTGRFPVCRRAGPPPGLDRADRVADGSSARPLVDRSGRGGRPGRGGSRGRRGAWGAVVVLEQLAPVGAAALARVPGTALDPFDRLVVAFLTGRKQAHTKTAYAADLTAWRSWCLTEAPSEYRVHPLLATRPHVDAWVDHLGRTPSARTGRPPSPASVARRLSALSTFYAHVQSLGVLDRSPLDHVERPQVSDESSTVGLTATELVSLLDAHSPRAAALISVLVFTGCRIFEAPGADLTDYRHDRGHRVLRIRRKGGKRASVALPPATVRVLDDLIGERTHGPIFLSRTHGPIFLSRTGGPLAYKTAYDLIKRLAKTAGMPPPT